ncbi:1-acyl-sn-glycerol-3-phosphate acyltransferase [Paraglaciecola sp. MB-3u-78]|uniref:1-acyl-sn-glycerol-3-phosphate acyltransferase n=1 Tax=Paraglaciecola sp. MB-3u-78 TaxID=2058332 RepID=UPI000C31F47B|nr:1-acyl-sn-glycerol-3-phosphate acyltransferase [Paraglaciecola sp. MB-3u-78]PKH00594.1 cytochrome C oxidase Cbb3 [Paraglaciecola sp. MB-3u-78]
MPTKFDSIRPFDDSDLCVVLPKLFKNKEFIDSIVAFKFSAWPQFMRPTLGFFTRHYIIKQITNVTTHRDFQRLVEPYMERMINTTTESFTVSGLDKLDLSQACLFMSNHRDIALDPAFVNWALHINGQDTVRIAVGDNLLKKEWVADLIRLNKCFIVKRSATDRREKLAAAKLLSEYIEFSLNTEQQHIWIAQREGRAKDGNDITNPAILSMLALNKSKDVAFSQYIRSLRIVPVSISYEFDPCDINKAKELQEVEREGCYDKPDNEDVRSIVNGITGQKGRVHIHFGEVLAAQFSTAKEAAGHIDQEILQGYQSFPTGSVAAEMLSKDGVIIDKNTTESDHYTQAATHYLQARLVELTKEEQNKLLSMYACAYMRKNGLILPEIINK